MSITLDGDYGDGEALLRWRERVLRGVIATCVIALVPPLGLMCWQWIHGVPGLQSGLALGFGAVVGLTILGLWRGAYRVRAVTLIGIGFVTISSAIISEGFAPAQFAAVCTLITIGVLLYSARAAYVLLLGSGLVMAVAAFAYSRGYLTPLDSPHLDVRDPLNWFRVALFTIFPCATTTVATSYLLGKLRTTLRARSALVARLGDEVAQRERALAELEATQARLLQAQKLEAIGQLAAGIAHDFNNTLSVVALEAELLKRRNYESDGVSRGADALLSAAERGRQLTRQLLLFSRIESTARPIVDVVPTFEECVGTLTRLLPSEITFRVEIGQGPLHVCVLPSELQQIVLNLGINARDAMPGGGTLSLSLERRRYHGDTARRLGLAAGEYVALRCGDTGAGMDAPTLSRVFEPFFTTKGPGRGTGLGLTNVWNIAQRCGGCVQAESTLGEGTSVCVYLPLSAAQPHVEESAPAIDSGRNETVLVVEDDIRLRALLVTLLSDAGYSVLDAPSVDVALALEREHRGPIDLVCTDVVMPGRPARELLAEMRRRRPRAGVLVCSGYSEDEQIARGIRSGEFKHLDKPFTRGALLAAVRGAIDAV